MKCEKRGCKKRPKEVYSFGYGFDDKKEYCKSCFDALFKKLDPIRFKRVKEIEKREADRA